MAGVLFAVILVVCLSAGDSLPPSAVLAELLLYLPVQLPSPPVSTFPPQYKAISLASEQALHQMASRREEEQRVAERELAAARQQVEELRAQLRRMEEGRAEDMVDAEKKGKEAEGNLKELTDKLAAAQQECSLLR